MKKSKLSLAVAMAATVFTLSVSALEKPAAGEAKAEDAKPVAWYVAHLKEARAKNKECYGDPNAKERQSTPDCVNSLQALKISFVGAN
jgi:hypothetical protein